MAPQIFVQNKEFRRGHIRWDT